MPGPLLFSTREIPAHERRLAGDDSPLATLVRLFLLDLPNDPAAAEGALGHALAQLHDVGFVAEESGRLYGTVRIVPHDGLLIVSDTLRVESGPDHVAGVHGPSEALSSLTVRRPVARALDVGPATASRPFASRRTRNTWSRPTSASVRSPSPSSTRR